MAISGDLQRSQMLKDRRSRHFYSKTSGMDVSMSVSEMVTARESRGAIELSRDSNKRLGIMIYCILLQVTG